ncbi:MAG: Dabb family protein [Phaeodactylibacter sp.]|nr:Dabb family protein [Phaeodactylibacter sp.]
MKNPFFFLLLFLFLLPACQQQVDPNLQEELSRARIRLQEMEAEVEKLRAGPEKGKLIHIVFLKTKEGLPEEEMAALIGSIRKLGEIGLVKSLEVGKLADTGDERFVTGHNIAFQMAFDGMADYQAYMEHPTHLEIRESLKGFLSGPPAVYDYWVE